MDYFSFDLQLFAAIGTVNVSSFADAAPESTKYLVGGVWYDSVAEIPEESRGKIVATLKGKALTIAVGTEDSNTVTVKTTAAAKLQGYTVKTVNSFSTAGAATTTKAVATVVSFVDSSNDIGSVGKVSTGASTSAASSIVFDEKTPGLATVSAGCTVDDMTVPASGTADFKLAASGSQELAIGTVTIPAGTDKSGKVGTNVYTNANADATASIKATVEAANTTVSLMGGAVTFTTSMKIVANGATIEADKGGTDGVTVNSSGVISNLDAGEVVIVDGVAYGVVTGDGGYITVSGETVSGVYTGVQQIDKVTLTASSTGVVVAETGNNNLKVAEVTAGDKLEIPAATAVGTRFFVVTYDTGTGKLVLADSAAADENTAATTANAIGYFAVTTSNEYGEAKATVVFKNTSKAVSKLNTPVTIDFTNLTVTDTTSNTKLNAIDVSGVSTATTIEGVAQSVGTNVTGATKATYLPGYALDSSAKIEIPATVTYDVYYALTVKTAGSDANRNITTYTIGTGQQSSTVPTGLANTSYIKVSSTGEVSFASNSGAVTNLSADCWRAIPIVATANTGLNNITFDESSLGSGTFTVTAKVGVTVETNSASLAATPNWTSPPNPVVSFVGGTASSGGITFTTSITLWKVQKTNTNGNPSYNLVKENTSLGTDPGFTITKNSPATGDVKIAYNGVGGKLTDLGYLDTGKTQPAKIVLDATGITGQIDISDGVDGADTNVDYHLTNVAAGTKIVGWGTGDEVTFVEAFKNEISLNLKALATAGTTVFYEVKAGTQDKTTGYRSVTLGSKITTATEANPPADTVNYYSIKEEDGVYTVKYVKATSGTGDKIDLASTSTSIGTTEIDATGLAGTATIHVYTQDTVGATEIANAAAGVTTDQKDADGTGTSGGAVALVTNYDTVYELAGVDIGLVTTTTHYWTISPSNDGKGTVTLTIAANANDSPPTSGTSFIQVVASDGGKTLSLKFDANGGTVTEEQLAQLAKKIPVTGTGLTGVTKIDLTDSSVDTLAFAVKELPKEVTTTTGTDDDTFAYHKTYTMSATENTLTLGSTVGKLYYAVTESGGDLGVYTVSVASEPVDLTGLDADAIAEKLGAIGNYFIVEVLDNAKKDVTVKYHKAGGTKGIDLTQNDTATGTGLAVKVDASGIAKKDQGAGNDTDISFTDGSATIGNVTITGIVDTNTTTTVTGVSNTPVKTYDAAYTITETNPIALNSTAGSVQYYKVAITSTANNRTTYEITTAAVGTKGDHYFVVTNGNSNGTAFGTTITYINADGDKDYDLAATGKQVTVDASGLAGSKVNTINIADDATNAGVNYALNSVPATVTTIEGLDEGKDTVTYAATAKLAADQKITLADAETQYFVVGGTAAAATVTAADSKPADTANYFTVKRTANGTTPETYTYTMAYHKSVGGTAWDIAKSADDNALTIAADALASGSTLALANTTPVAKYAVTGANGGLKVSGENTALPYDTVSYSQSFDGTPGIYYIKKNTTSTDPDYKKANFPNDLQATITKADNGSDYVQVTIKQDAETKKYKVEVGAKLYNPNTNTGVMTPSSTDVSIGTNTLLYIEAPDTAGSKLDVNSVAFTEITGVAKNSVLENVVSTTVVTTADLAKADKVTIGSTDFISGGGKISITNEKANAGTFLVSATDADALVGSTATDTDPATVSIVKESGSGDGQVLVTFKDGKISEISGLQVGEVLTVTSQESTPTVSYVYTNDGTRITRTAKDGTKRYAGASTANLADESAFYATESMTVGNFTWTDGTYYVKATGAAGTADVKATATSALVANGTYYIKAVYDSGATPTLKLSAFKGNSANLLDPATDFTGTINVAVEGNKKITYVKGADDGFKLAFTGVGAQSSFTDLGASDTVTTGQLGTTGNDKVSIITTGTGGDTKVYTNALADGTLEFVGGALKNGTIAVGNNVTNLTSDGAQVGAKIVGGATCSATILVENGAISSIKNFGNGESLTVTEADGTVTTFTATSDTAVTRVVTDADGNTTSTALTIVAGADVWAATGTETVVNNFDVTNGGVGYFKIPSTPVPAVNDTSTLTLTPGDTYVRAEITKADDKGFQTLTLASYIVSDEKKLIPASSGATAGQTVTVNTAGQLSYDGTGVEPKVKFAAAGNGSVFKNLNPGDTVATPDDALGAGGKITVNGTEYKAVEASSEFTIYAETTTTSRIVAGKLKLDKDTLSVNGAKGDGSEKFTVTYAPKAATDDITVEFEDGNAKAVTNAENGSAITVVKTDSSGSTTTVYTWVADNADAGKSYVYKTVGNTTTYTATSVTTANALTLATIADKTGTDTKDAFSWTDSSEAASVKGYFLVSETTTDTGTTKTVTAQNQTSKVNTDYTQYGKTYLVATYTKPVSPATVGELTLQKAVVLPSGKLDPDTNFVGTEGIDVALAVSGGKAFTYARAAAGAVKSLTITGAGAGTSITTNWQAADSITTVALGVGDTITLKDDTNPAVTYTSGAASNILEVKGTNLVNGTFRMASAFATANASYTDGDNKVTATTITYTPTGASTADVKVVNGIVKSVTGMGDGETIQVAQTTKDKLGNVVTAETFNYIYEAHEIPSGAKAGQIEVTRTDKNTGTKATHTFTSDAQDILASSVNWIESGSSSTSAFNWNNTGYFAATLVSDAITAIADVADQTLSPAALGVGTYLKVTATTDTTGKVTVSEMKLVDRDADGMYTDSKKKFAVSTYKVPVTVTASTNFSANTLPLAITASEGLVYTGLNDDDTLTVNFTGTGKKITVGETTYNSSGATAVVIDGNGAVQDGSLTIGATAITDEAGNTIVATKGDAVVSFTAYDADAKTGGITNIGALAANESVTFTAADGIITKYTADGTATSFTREITSTDGTETWTTTAANVTTNGGVSNMLDYVPAKTFDFGKTAAGKIGYFDEGDPVEKTPATAANAVVDNGTYVRVVSTYDEEKKVYTVSSLQKLKYVAAKKAFEVANGTTAVEIKSQGSMTIADGAVVTPAKDPADPTKGYEDRKYTFAVTGAKAGETYAGFGAEDTVATTGSADLKAGETLTVGGVTYTAGQTTSATIYGDGMAQAGTFALANGATLTGKVLALSTTTTVTGKGDAQVRFTGGLVNGVFGLASGESVTIKTALESGAVKTETYAASGSDPENLTITKTTVEDGVTTTATFVGAKESTNVAELTYTAPTATITSKFDWTAETGAGYFEVTPTIEAEKVTKFSDATIAPQPRPVTLEKGKYYLKTALAEDGTVNGVTLVQVTENGTLSDNLLLATTEGKIAITAPTAKALTFNAGTTGTNPLSIPAGVAVAITGAIDGSVIAGLKNGDTVATAELGAPAKNAAGNSAYETVTVNGTRLSAGAATTMKFVINNAGDAVLSAGVVALPGIAKNASVSFKTTGANDKVGTGNEADDVTVTFTQHNDGVITTLDTPVITVQNGQITAVTGVATAGSQLVVAAGGGTTQTYTAGAVAITGLANDAALTTAKLDAGTTVTCGTLSFTTAEAGQAIIQNEGSTPTLSSGTIAFAAGGSVTLTGATKAAGDTKVLTYSQTAAGYHDVIVKVQNGVVTSITGMETGDRIVYGDTTYEAVSDTHIQKSVGTVVSHAYITAQGDIYTASYIGDGSEISTENPLEGQLSWTDVSGRATGYFAIKETTKKDVTTRTATIAEQASKVTIAAPKAGVTAKYLVANVSGNELTVSGMTVTTDAAGVTTTASLDTTDATKFTSADTITITAPTTTWIDYDKAGAKFSVAINKLAAWSTVANLAKGDKVVTNTLESGQRVTVGGQTYMAGAKNALTIVGETNTTATTRTAALMSGTIRLNSAYTSAVLAGTKDATIVETDDVTVSFDDNSGAATESVTVKVANGAVTSITGLVTQGAKVTVAPTGGTQVVYEVLDTAGTMIRRTEGTEISYKTVKQGAEIFTAVWNKNGYTEAVETDANTLTDWTTPANTKVAYIALDTSAENPVTKVIEVSDNKKLTSTAAKTARSGDVITDKFKATPEKYYLRVTASTAKSGVTTIKAIDLMQAGANGKLAAVKATVAAYTGTLTIDGSTATSTANADDAKIAYALPKTKTWKLNAENVQVGTTFTNIGANDQITSASITTLTDFAKGTYVLYNANGTGTDTQTVTIAGDGVKLTESAGAVTGITGLYTKNETVTLRTETLAGGETTVVYKVTAAGSVQRTTTTADGKVEVKTITGVTDAYDVIADTAGKWAEAEASGFQLASNFDWTMQNTPETYAAIKNSAATVKAGKVSVTSKNVNSLGYIALGINADGTVADGSVKHVYWNKDTGEITEAENAYTGKINIAAPTAKPLVFSRGDDLSATSIGDAAQIVITGAVAGSVITGLASHGTYATGDSVTTAALAKSAVVAVNTGVFTAVSGGKLAFTAQEVDEKAQITLTGGTIALSVNDGETEGVDFAYVGDRLITATKGGVNVTANTKVSRGVATTGFTITDLGEGETFTVESFGSGAQTATYMKSGTTLFRTIAGQEGTYVYTIGSKTKVDSTILDKASNWKAVVNTFDTDATTDMMTLVSGGAVTIDLATLDKRIAADNKAVVGLGTATQYDFVVDTYLASAMKKKANLAASVVTDPHYQNLASVQTLVGQQDAAGTYIYNATKTIAQTIKATKGWTVNGSDGDDIITGAAGKATDGDVLVGGKGNDSLIGGAVADTFTVGEGQDTIKGFGNGVDEVDFVGFTSLDNISLTGANVLLHTGIDADNDGVMDNSVLLQNMGNGKAVTINNATYYFGNGATKAGKAATFVYDTVGGAYYYANASLKNTLSVGTDKTKATAKTLGDTVEIDLNAEGAVGKYYTNIAAVDASKSGNRVKLTALAETNTTLKGGTYQSTLVGGTGNDSLVSGTGTDVFWFENLAGNDVVSGYNSAKQNDAVYLGDWDGESTAANLANGVTVQGAADNKSVILTNGTDTVSLVGALGAAKAVKISKDGTTTNTLSYYVGAAGTAKKAATNNFTVKVGTDVDVTTTTDTSTDPATVTTTETWKSYYIGSDSATDTLKLAAKDKKSTVGDAKDYAQFVMEGAHFQSIDVLDASALVAGSYVELVGKTSGTFTLKGSASAKSYEKFNLNGLTKDNTKAIIQNLTAVSDVVELAAGMKLTQVSAANAANTIYNITDAGGNSYGQLQINGVKSGSLQVYTDSTGVKNTTVKRV